MAQTQTKPKAEKNAKKGSKLSSLKYYWTLLPFLVLVCMFELVPLATMIIRSFSKDKGSGFTFEHYLTIFEKQIYLTAIKNSLGLTLFAAVAGMIIVFLLAMALSNSKKKMRGVYMSMLTLTSNFAGLPLAFSFITMLGYSGVFVLIGKQLGIQSLAEYNLYTVSGLALIYIYFQIPMGTLLLLPAFEGIHKEWKESAALMKANSFQFWWKVGIPVMMPSIAGTFTMLFANALTAYATPFMLIANSIPLLPVKISDMFVGDLRSRPELGSALSITMLLIMLLVIGLSNLVKRAYTKGERR